MTDIKTRLLELNVDYSDRQTIYAALRDAADEIEKLRNREDQLLREVQTINPLRR